ncbi:dienelactone hydrolase family protein [Corynebacterium epidermidicanis]|uniref:Acyl-CoA thioester hydrolase family protein n=1 Tax=Corynebacterium epidermidicanis TaxID=1050174 RepID=A0A0G3GMD6_9CORY|nr:hypothetical protein [Corynebacterium epidermidicanis]AKK02396.1 acyl-CoA thioester hydrolase family protein [Corynebacterium epidermidicanis]
MKKILKILLAFVIIVSAVIGVRAYNVHRYALPEGRPQEASSYPTTDRITHIEGTYLSGFHFQPVEKKHAGTVVVFGGSEGSPDYARARQLWEAGYEVLALFFFGQPNQKNTLADVPLEFFDEVTTRVSEGPVTVVGSSKGAELTANLATHGAKIDNIVLFTPTEYTFQGLAFGREEHPSFSQGGQPLPYLAFKDFRS